MPIIAPKRTKIVCTIGPASRDPATLFKLGQAGMDVARLNFSHGTYDEHRAMFKHLGLVGKRLGKPFAILQDLQGPKIRVGDLPKEGVKLVTGRTAIFATGSNIASGDIPVTLESLHQDVKRGERMLLDDGLLEVQVQHVEGRRVFTQVIQGGTLTSHKGLNLPGTKLSLPALSDKDRADAAFGVSLGVDFIALSFVRSPEDVKDLRRLLDRKGPKGKRIKIVVKIEKQEGVDRFDEILPLTDAVMIGRGDLGIETPAANVPVIQKQLIAACREAGKPVIVATQMLDSMIRNPRPTRAEVSDIANAVTDHADAVMLSGETASGSYPVEAVRVMADTIRATEASRFDDVNLVDVTAPKDMDDVVGATVRVLVEALEKPPVVVLSDDGRAVHDISSFRPETPVHAIVTDPHMERVLQLTWGVQPICISHKKTPELLLKAGLEALRKAKRLKHGQRLILVSGTAASRRDGVVRVEITKA
ncbi:MAG: pyruvate kinase [Patescibacteria group bacterium]|jgi:pyruvate kinase